MCGFVASVNELISVQNKVYKRPTIIIANKVTGEEEIPDGVVGVLTPDMPDVLSHVSVRARTSKVLNLVHLFCLILIFMSYLHLENFAL